MRGVILAGGTGSRMMPLTKVTNKHLLPVYDKPMIYYPLYTLINSGIKDVMIVSGKGHAGHFLELLGSGKAMDINLRYAVQEEAGGIAQALSLTESFVGEDNIAVILGDNIFEDSFKEEFFNFKEGAKIFLKKVPDPEKFGIAEVNFNKIISIEEKPKNAKSNYAVTGLYLYDNKVFDIIKNLKPSQRGELEITDVNNNYLQKNQLEYSVIKGYWSDAGSFDTLLRSSLLVSRKIL